MYHPLHHSQPPLDTLRRARASRPRPDLDDAIRTCRCQQWYIRLTSQRTNTFIRARAMTLKILQKDVLVHVPYPYTAVGRRREDVHWVDGR